MEKKKLKKNTFKMLHIQCGGSQWGVSPLILVFLCLSSDQANVAVNAELALAVHFGLGKGRVQFFFAQLVAEFAQLRSEFILVDQSSALGVERVERCLDHLGTVAA